MLSKTRPRKIMRSLLSCVAEDPAIGNTTTVANP